MDSLVYRKIKKDDYAEIKKLIIDAFEFDKFISNANVLNSIVDSYLHMSLLKSSFSKCVEKDGKIIGFILAESRYDKSKSIDNVNYSKAIQIKSFLKLIFADSLSKKEISEFSQIAKGYDSMKNELKDEYDGSIVLFIVSPESRGLGIGKRLISIVNKYFEDNKAFKYYLYTDTRCNYGFYDNQGFLRVNEKEITFVDGLKDLDVFIYEYKIKKDS